MFWWEVQGTLHLFQKYEIIVSALLFFSSLVEVVIKCKESCIVKAALIWIHAASKVQLCEYYK
jgi:cytochrome c oxidase assembly factor CtaG